MQIRHLSGPEAFSLAVHGGAGPRQDPLTDKEEASYSSGLRAALSAGRTILSAGGNAVDAVCASVVALEDHELFNAGRGAALTAEATVELDAALMVGSGLAGAITGTTIARNPVLAARAVMENTPHVLLHAPAAELLEHWGVATEDPSYFATQLRFDQLKGRAASDASSPHRDSSTGDLATGVSATGEPTLGKSAISETAIGHGTVGAVARDRQGNLAAATSTGGVTGQMIGRIGDSPLIGAGTFANREVAISCTGIGEYFIRAVLAHDIAARMSYGKRSLPEAVSLAIAEGLTQRGGFGGVIAVDQEGGVVLAFNSAAMFRGYANESSLHVEV